ncbi:MAG TPA: mannose-1-phosphate guanylyltransferase [Spirochaetia bacterium]|nr:mannose-1-phosphate guanylyltransferase [Spirochaetia bacterium]
MAVPRIGYAIVLAGGAGTRLWPASTRSNPKQFLRIGGRKSLLELTLERALALDVRKILIVTHQSQAESVAREISALPQIAERSVIISEPAARNTAPALALAARYLSSIGATDEISIVMPADHLITPLSTFTADAAVAAEIAHSRYLVTFGIRPSRPETGYGYIETGDTLGSGWYVHSFREKPDQATAIHYLKAGNYYWNSGMFVFRNDFFRAELAERSPEVADQVDRLGDEFPLRRVHGVPVCGDMAELSSLYASLPSISIDYALMEKSARRAMVAARFSWNDVGSWDEIAAISETDAREQGQEAAVTAAAARHSPIFMVEANRCHVESDLPVALCGVDDLHVIVKNGMILVCRRGSSQLVKEAVQEMKAEGYERLL